MAFLAFKNIQDSKNDDSLFSSQNYQNNIKNAIFCFGILVRTVLIEGQFWTIEKITTKS